MGSREFNGNERRNDATDSGTYQRIGIGGPFVKIRRAKSNRRKKAFEIQTSTRQFEFPYARATPKPTGEDPVVSVDVDKELGREAFTYELKSGRQGSVHIEQVQDYNEDPAYLRDTILYQLTLEAQKRLKSSPLSKREIIRRLGTSATQFYRLVDQTNYRKSVDQILSLLHVLDCRVELKVRTRRPAGHAA
jgi:hypothetical protein